MAKILAYWLRNKHGGNSALGSLYSLRTDRPIAHNVSLSYAKLVYKDYDIFEKK